MVINSIQLEYNNDNLEATDCLARISGVDLGLIGAVGAGEGRVIIAAPTA